MNIKRTLVALEMLRHGARKGKTYLFVTTDPVRVINACRHFFGDVPEGIEIVGIEDDRLKEKPPTIIFDEFVYKKSVDSDENNVV